MTFQASVRRPCSFGDRSVLAFFRPPLLPSISSASARQARLARSARSHAPALLVRDLLDDFSDRISMIAQLLRAIRPACEAAPRRLQEHLARELSKQPVYAQAVLGHAQPHVRIIGSLQFEMH